MFWVIMQQIVVITYWCFGTTSWSWELGPIGCTITSVWNYHYLLCNNPEDSSSLLLHSRSLKSCIIKISSYGYSQTYIPINRFFLKYLLLSWTLYIYNCSLHNIFCELLRTRNLNDQTQCKKLWQWWSTMVFTLGRYRLTMTCLQNWCSHCENRNVVR